MKTNKFLHDDKSLTPSLSHWEREKGRGNSRKRGATTLSQIITASAISLLCLIGLTFAEWDPLRQMSATVAKPNVYLMLDASVSMGAPLDGAGEGPAAGKLFINNFGGWRYLTNIGTAGHSASFPYGVGGANLCDAGVVGGQCVGYAWYEPSRLSALKNVLGNTIGIRSLKFHQGGGCQVNCTAQYDGKTCEARTNFPYFSYDTACGAEKANAQYLAPVLTEGDTLGSASYSTYICVSDPHIPEGAAGGGGGGTTLSETATQGACALSFAAKAKGSAECALVDAFTEANPTRTTLARVEYTLGGNVPGACATVTLLGPAGGEQPLTGSPADVTTFYTGQGLGDYRIRLTVNGCAQATSVKNTLMTVQYTKEEEGGGDIGGTHPNWNAYPCSFFSSNNPPINETIQTSTTSAVLDKIYRSPVSIIDGVSKSMNLGLMVYSTKVTDAIVGSYTEAVGGRVAMLVKVNPDDDDLWGQQYNVARINAFMKPEGVSTSVLDPNAGVNRTINGLSTTTNPTSPFNESDANWTVDLYDELMAGQVQDERSKCRRNYMIMLVDSHMTSGDLASCGGQVDLWTSSIDSIVKGPDGVLGTLDDIKVFVIQFGPSGRRYNANLFAYTGRTDANAKAEDGGLWETDPYLVDPWGTYNNACTGCSLDCSPSAGTGQHDFAYFASNADELARAFEAIFRAIAMGDFVTAPPSVTPTSTTVGASGEYYIGLMSSAQYPGWKGHLRAYELRSANPVQIWDAGQMLADRDITANPRSLWTFKKSAQSDAQATILTKVSDLADPLLTESSILTLGPTDPASQKVSLTDFINFVYGYDGYNYNGAGAFGTFINNGSTYKRAWLLGDTVNTTAVLVEKTLEYGLYPSMAENKKNFDAVYENRHGLVYLPANDGFLHAFDVVDGYEVFGFMPPSQVDSVALMYLEFRAELERQWVKRKSKCLEVCIKNCMDGGGDSATCGANCSATCNTTDLWAEANAKVPNPTGQKPYVMDEHIYTNAAPVRVGDIRVPIPGSETTDQANYRWRTVLFMGEGKGGYNIYALDVTHPYPERSGVYDPMRETTRNFNADNNYSTDSDFVDYRDVPFRYLWRINPQSKEIWGGTETFPFAGLGETWATLPVGLIKDPMATDSKIFNNTFAVSFGSYFKDPAESLTPEQRKYSWWVARAYDGKYMKKFNLDPNVEVTGDPPDTSLPLYTKCETPPGPSPYCAYRKVDTATTAEGDTDDNVAYRRICDLPAICDPGLAYIPNSIFADSVMMETDQMRYYPDGMVTQIFQADQHGRIWRADVSDVGGMDWDINNWTANWLQYLVFDLADDDVKVSAFKSDGTQVPSYGTPVGSQPIQYSPAIAHLYGNKRFALAFSTGGWGETDEDVAGRRFYSHAALVILKDNWEICDRWIVPLPEIEPETGGEHLTLMARVTGSPLMIIKSPTLTDDPTTLYIDESQYATRGALIYTVYDPGKIDASTGFCVGTSYVIVVSFEITADCPSATAHARVIKIGIGFATLTAGPDAPIIALSGVGHGAQATIVKEEKLPDIEIPSSSTVRVLSWQELDCQY